MKKFFIMLFGEFSLIVATFYFGKRLGFLFLGLSIPAIVLTMHGKATKFVVYTIYAWLILAVFVYYLLDKTL